MARKLYPIGIQTFEEIRKLDNLYIDKTEYIYCMTHTDGKYFFLSRPRRFGKSLLVSTFQSYFEGKKELFEGLAIEKLEKEWNTYPVLHFDLSKGKHMEKEQLNRYLLDIIEKQEARFDCMSNKIDVNIRLDDLINAVYQKTGKQVVVLIDEYDAPLLDVAHEKEKLDELRNTMRNFYSPLKGNESMLRFVFMTGITKFSQLSIFSELNNLDNISLFDQYSAICGISKTELTTQMKPDIEAMGEALNMTYEECLKELTQFYDGYHFSEKSEDIFNPFSLVKAMNAGKIAPYWFGSGTPSFLLKLLDKYHVNLSTLESQETVLSSFDQSTEEMTEALPLLYQSGYLTIKKYEPMFQEYTLGIPNKEVRDGLLNSLIPHYVNPRRSDNNAFLLGFCKAVYRNDIEAALEHMRTYMATIPYDLENHSEKHYQTIFYLMFSFLNIYIRTEVKSAIGRADAVMHMPDTIYVFELKVDKSADEALAQIDEKGYMLPYHAEGKRLIKIGISFDSTQRTISDWKIKEE